MFGAARMRAVTRFSDTFSVKSKSTRGSSVFRKLQKDISELTAQEFSIRAKSLRVRDWILAFAEFCLSLSWNALLLRQQSERALQMKGQTPRIETMNRLYWIGCSGFGNLFMGYIADAYSGNYRLVMVNVFAQFTLSSLFLISMLVTETDRGDEYGLVLSHVFAWSFVPIKSTDFARFVYAMEQLVTKDNALVLHFAFVIMFSDALGSLTITITKHFGVSERVLTFLVFGANGMVVYLYAYILRPQKTLTLNFTRGVARNLLGCIITGIKNKRKFGDIQKGKHFLDLAETKYEKVYISKTKEFIKLITMLLPTAGFTLFTTGSADFFHEFWAHLKGEDLSSGAYLLVQVSPLISMVTMENLIIPVIRKWGVRINFLKRFMIGYVALLLAMYYCSVVLGTSQRYELHSNIGMLRVFNAREKPIKLVSQDPSFSDLNFFVEPNDATLVNYYLDKRYLFRMKVLFDNTTDYVTHFSIQPNAMVTYIAVDPPDVIRVQGRVPIKEGPPGNNSDVLARCFAANFIRGRLYASILLFNLETRDTFEVNRIKQGETRIFQIKEGTYAAKIVGTTVEKKVQFLIGGVYGMMMYTSLNDYRLAFDQVQPENTISDINGLGVSIPLGIAYGIALVALQAFVYSNAPEGLTGLSYGYLIFTQRVTSWILVFGFATWHYYLTPAAHTIYSFGATSFFFLCLVLLVKYRSIYTM